ncbi:MAG: hypothetical protein N3D09_05145, partial [Archaeoglobaceae archaeon]|nr:hypothetical protein [Archaeoglobaceae archaeon]
MNEMVKKVVIRKKKAKEGYEYPILILPVEFLDLVGFEAEIYRVKDGFFVRIPQVGNSKMVGNSMAEVGNSKIENENKNSSKNKRDLDNSEKIKPNSDHSD